MSHKPATRSQPDRQLESDLAAYSASNQPTLGRQRREQKGRDRRLAIYTGAAGAAFAGAFPAEAAIQYYDVNWTINTGYSKIFDMGDGGDDVQLDLTYSTPTYRGYASRRGTAKIATLVGDAVRFTTSATIGPLALWQSRGLLFNYYSSSFDDGNFSDVSTGYLGVRFGSSPVKYGWIHIDWIGADGQSYHVDDYAYQDNGSWIQAGDTGEVPEPSTIALALLASGAAGVMASRRKKILKGRK